MKTPQTSWKASVKSWDNSSTFVTADAVARCFARENLTGEMLARAGRVLDVFRADPREAKRIAGEVHRSEFGSAREYLLWTQFTALLLKSGSGGSPSSRRDAATASFLAAEARCRRTNRRLRHFADHPNRENPLYRVILTRARKLISQVLGNFTESTLEHILDMAKPGSGSALGTIDRHRTSTPFKLGEHRPVTTEKCLPYAEMLLARSCAWLPLVATVDWERGEWWIDYEIARANQIGFVPKDALTDRTIATEPHLNMCLQLGTHAYIARRLKAFGVDIHSQLRNQRLARKGALLWQTQDPLATLDLSSASDCVSIALVERLLPTVWREFLDDIRSSHYCLGKQSTPVEFQKWSSMGNGYTFVLETLIFWALGAACLTFVDSDDEIAVYGDDIVLPRSAALLMTEILRYTGFVINTDKSFVTGPFRESCGEDYWGATRVVPCYIRGADRLRPTDLYRLVNRISDSGFSTLELRSLVVNSHSPVLYGLRTVSNDSAVLWEDPVVLMKTGRLWPTSGSNPNKPNYQAYYQYEARFRPFQGRIPLIWGYVAKLLGGSTLPWDPNDEFATKAVHRVRGVWTPVRTVVG